MFESCSCTQGECLYYFKGGLLTTTEITISSLLTGAVEVIPTAVSAAWELATSNVYLTFFLGVGLLSLGFSFFKRIRKTIH